MKLDTLQALTEKAKPKAPDNDGIRDGLNIKLDSQTRSLAGRLTRPMEKRIVGLFALVGIPGRYLTADGIEDGIRGGAEKLFPVGSSTSRAFSDLYQALAQMKGVTSEAGPADDKGGAKRGSFLQKLLESVLVELGLPGELVVTGGPGPVGAALYRTAQALANADGAERALRNLGRRLGISAADAMATVPEAKAPRGKQETSPEMYARLSARIDELLAELKTKRKAHAKKAAADPKNYGYGGDLGRIVDNLEELVGSFMLGSGE